MKRAQRHNVGCVRFDKRRKTWNLPLVSKREAPFEGDRNQTGISDESVGLETQPNY